MTSHGISCGPWVLDSIENCFVIAILARPHAVGRQEHRRVIFCVYGVTYSIRTWILNVISMNNHVFLNQCLVTRTRVSRYNSATEAPITASKVPMHSPTLKLSRGMNNSIFQFCAISQFFQN